MAVRPRKIPVVFYRTPAGTEVVRIWLRGLDESDRNIIGQDLMRVQYRWPVGMPLRRATRRSLGGPQRPCEQPDCTSAVQRPARQAPCSSWLRQEEPEDAK